MSLRRKATFFLPAWSPLSPRSPRAKVATGKYINQIKLFTFAPKYNLQATSNTNSSSVSNSFLWLNQIQSKPFRTNKRVSNIISHTINPNHFIIISFSYHHSPPVLHGSGQILTYHVKTNTMSITALLITTTSDTAKPHQPRNSKTAKPENRSSFLLKWF